MSSTIEVVGFAPGHLLLIRTKMSDDERQHIALQAEHGPSWTLMVDGRVAMCFGATILWDGLAEAWMVISDIARGKPKATVKAIKQAIAYTMQSHRLSRLQAHVKTSDRRAIRFSEHLGYVREGTLRKFGSGGEDYDLMAIVR